MSSIKCDKKENRELSREVKAAMLAFQNNEILLLWEISYFNVEAMDIRHYVLYKMMLFL